jgi:YjbE family integral membrane protein
VALFSPEWLAALLAIVVIDLLLAGDNAIVIALAARNLPPVWQKRAVVWGTLGAIVARVLLVLLVGKLLKLPGLALAGGLALYYIAWQLLNKPPKSEGEGVAAGSFWAAMKTIIIADTIMGLDNVLAIAAAAKGDPWLVGIGLGLSIPIMMFGSVMILKLLNRAPWLVVAGAGLLAGIAGGIALDDSLVRGWLDWQPATRWTVVVVVALAFTALAQFCALKKAQAKA